MRRLLRQSRLPYPSSSSASARLVWQSTPTSCNTGSSRPSVRSAAACHRCCFQLSTAFPLHRRLSTSATSSSSSPPTVPTTSSDFPADDRLSFDFDDGWIDEDDALIEKQLEGGGLSSPTTSTTPAPLPPLAERVEQQFGEDAREYVPPSFDERVSALPQLYTATEVRSHSEVDACKYFPVSEEQHAALPSPLSSALSEEFSTAGQFLQLHPAYLPFIARLSALHSPRGRFYLRKPWLVDGAHGSGRTTLLYYLHLWANESGWLVVSAQADEFSREKMGWHTDNPERSGIRDQPLYTQHFMAQLAKRQGDKLSMVQLKRSRPSAPDCTTLLDLVQLAASDAQLAPVLLYDIVDELRRVTEVPVLVLIDNLNVWDVSSDYVDPHYHSRPLPARRLALVDAFSTFCHIAPERGAVVMCTASHATLSGLRDHMNLRKVRPVRLLPYNDQQLKHAMVHYHVSGALLSTVTHNLITKVKNLSGGFPKQVQLVAQSF